MICLVRTFTGFLLQLIVRGGREYDRDGEGLAVVKVGVDRETMLMIRIGLIPEMDDDVM